MKNLFKFIKLSAKIHKPFIFTVLLRAFAKSLLVIYNVYSLKFIIDALQNMDYCNVLMIGLMVALANMLFSFLEKLFTKLIQDSRLIASEKFEMALSDKLMSIPYYYLENPYYLDLKERSVFAVKNFGAIEQMLYSIGDFLSNLITLLGLLTIIALFDYLIIILLVVSIGLTVLINFIAMKKNYVFSQKLIPINRKVGYYVSTALDDKKGKDYRLSDIGSFIRRKYHDYNEEIIREINHQYNREIVIGSSLQIVNYIQNAVTYILITLKSLESFSIGNFSLYISAAAQVTRTANSLFNGILNLRAISFYIAPFIELLELKDTGNSGNTLISEIETIEFVDVHFKYPNTDKYILKGVSFKIKKSEKVSMVGLNGSGKTTIIKLLMRLYEIEEGTILINGINISEYEISSYYNTISAVFQDYKLFAYSIAENITGDDERSEEAYEVVSRISLKKRIDSLPNGINSNLSKAYNEDGVMLSGGEEQKIAIARALYKNSSFVILDEPTSALDPIAEAEIYTNFNSLVLDRTAIYISHRMSSSKFCDRIIVIDDGQVVSFDTHQNLMKDKESLYYKLFDSQAKNYQY